MTKNSVSVGSLWQDNDPRTTPARYLRVTAIEGDKAVCEAWYDRPGSQARTVRIRLDRFKPISTGYRLIEEPS